MVCMKKVTKISQIRNKLAVTIPQKAAQLETDEELDIAMERFDKLIDKLRDL